MKLLSKDEVDHTVVIIIALLMTALGIWLGYKLFTLLFPLVLKSLNL